MMMGNNHNYLSHNMNILIGLPYEYHDDCWFVKRLEHYGALALPGLEVVEDRGLVEVGQVGHVLAPLELGRVHLLHLQHGGQFDWLIEFVNLFN